METVLFMRGAGGGRRPDRDGQIEGQATAQVSDRLIGSLRGEEAESGRLPRESWSDRERGQRGQQGNERASKEGG